MKTFTIECIALETLCECNKLNIESVLEDVGNSGISFGANADTLVTKAQLENILKLRLAWFWGDSVLVSLGC